MLPVLLLLLPAALLSRPWRSPAGRALLAGCALGIVSFATQGRGYPYHRYPLVFFLLALCAWACLHVLPRWRAHRTVAACAAAALLISVTITIPRALVEMGRFTPQARPYRAALAAALRAHGGVALSGHVQCFDMAGGCLATLLDLNLLPATGYLYDCYAFAPVAPEMRNEQARYRAAWLTALRRTTPALLIVSSDECGPHDLRYRMLGRWPGLSTLLHQRYMLVDEWTPREEENWNGHPTLPFGFRLYALR